MKRELTKTTCKIWHIKDGIRREGPPSDESGDLTGVWGNVDDCKITQEDRKAGIHISELIAADAAVVSKEDADAIAWLKSEIKAYDLRMDNDAKRIAELKVERGEIILTLEAQDLSLAAKDARIAELQDELSDFWWYALQKESVKKSDGWLCPYMGDGEYAGPKLVEIGQAEKHPDKDWYRHIIAAADAAESSANDEE